MDGTRIGTILGTAAYMSPEQARGMHVSQSTDLWAFGCVLYEMLSGRSAFSGQTIADTIATILEREPNWQVLPRSTPRAIRELLRGCVRKDAQERLRSISIARSEIDRARTRLSKRASLRRLSMTAAGVAAALAVVLLVLLVASRADPPSHHTVASIEHEPVLIVISNFQNRTNDSAFDRTLEVTLTRALEEAGFIGAYDLSRIPSAFGMRPDRLDEQAAHALAVKQDAGIVISGSIDRLGNGYEVSVKAVQTMTSDVVSAVKGRALSKDEVLGVVTTLAANVRTALGDTTSETDQLVAMRSAVATSVDALSRYTAAMESQSRRRFDEAEQTLMKAIELDPKFGLAYQNLALLLHNRDRREEAEAYMSEALRHLAGMTEKERFYARGLHAVMTRDYVRCVKEYGDLVTRYIADAGAYNNRAVCLSALGRLREAADEMQKPIAILPKRAVFRLNSAAFLIYAGDFQAGEKQVQGVEDSTAFSMTILAFAQLGQGLPRQAAETYERVGAMSVAGASRAASGLGDLAIYEGRFSDAVRLLKQGAAGDVASKNPNAAAHKLVWLAYAHLSREQRGEAVTAAEQALKYTNRGSIRFLAARIFLEAGEVAKARTEAARISLGTFNESGIAGGSLRQNHRGEDCFRERQSTRRDQAAARGQYDSGYVVGAFRSGPCVSRSTSLCRGCCRVRPLRQTTRRGDVALL
jgi:eukaryotic-like serine/threonine-protein kinase